MTLNSQHLTDKEGQKILLDQEIASLPVAEIHDVQDFKKDETLPVKSFESPKSPERQECSKVILVESHAKYGKKECLWITPTPASIFEEHFESIPKVLFF